MFGLFFERLNNRRKKSEDKPKELSPRIPPKNTAGSPGPLTGPRINSLSPQSHNTQQYYFPQYSPQSTHTQNYFKASNDNKRINQTSASPPGKRINDSNTNIITKTNHVKKESKVKSKPNFEFRPLDKDSFSQNVGSITESTQEGSLLAQNLPLPKSITASKIPSKPIPKKHEPTRTLTNAHIIRKEDPNQMAFKVKNKDTGEVFDIRDMQNRKEFGQDDIKNKYGISLSRRQQAWQEWWTERKKTNLRLLEASKYGDVDSSMKLLDKKRGDLRADVNTKGDNDWTPLHFACLNGNIDLINLLLYNEANIDAETTLKFTPLIIASQKGHEEIVQLLINSGADVNCKDIYNNTPLHYAAQNGHKRIVQIFLSRPSINLHIKNNENKYPADLCDSKDIKKLFEVFLSEKSLLNSKFTQRVTIHNTKNDNIKKMFEGISDQRSQNHKKPRQSDFPDTKQQQKNQSYGHNSTGETKANSSLNTSGSDFSGSGSGIGDEEKTGPQSFIVHSMIGKGSFGEVYLVEKKSTRQMYAMKVLNKNKIMKHNLIKYALTERNVLSLTDHPFIVKLNWAFQTAEKLFLILDYAPGGDLGEHLQKERRFTEERAKIYLAEIILALEDLHKRDIIFRDLKPDNIVLSPDGHAMLTDFGLSKEGVLDHTQGAKSFCGSVAYLAPEMLKRVGHGKAVDWYLLGVVFYEMVVGVPPYYANNREQLFYNIEKAPLKIPSYLSTEAKSLLKGLLQRNPTKRLGSGKGDAEEVKCHSFFNDISWEDVLKKKLKPPLPEKKIKLSAKIPLNVFDNPDGESEKDRISGWSFVSPVQQNQN